MNDSRRTELERWVRHDLQMSGATLELLAGDASFRCYFRARHEGRDYVLMDAPPDKEPLDAYLKVTDYLRGAAVHVPEILAQDTAKGFLLLEDLGDDQYLSCLNEDSANALYDDAIETLIRIQILPRNELPPYDRALLLQELNLFTNWYLQRHLQQELSAADQATISQTWEGLIDNALEQPQVAVHRDYHSRNLMVSDPNPGVIDHQDAVWGPITYDLVSLLRDCYIVWPEGRVLKWAEDHYNRARDASILENAVPLDQFLIWFDKMGVQRHLKATGIFARLHHRDGKSAYLDDIPHVLHYVREVCANHSELRTFGELIARLPEAAP